MIHVAVRLVKVSQLLRKRFRRRPRQKSLDALHLRRRVGDVQQTVQSQHEKTHLKEGLGQRWQVQLKQQGTPVQQMMIQR